MEGGGVMKWPWPRMSVELRAAGFENYRQSDHRWGTRGFKGMCSAARCIVPPQFQRQDGRRRLRGLRAYCPHHAKQCADRLQVTRIRGVLATTGEGNAS